VTFFTALYEADEDGQDEMHRLLFASDDDGEDADEDPPHLKKRRIKEEEEDSQNQGSADLGDGEDAEEAEEDEDMEEPEDEEADGDGDSGDASGYGDPSASSKARQKAKASDSRAGKSVKGKKETAVNERRLLRKSPSDPQNPAKGITGKCQMCLKTSAKARSLTSHLTLHCMLASHITFSSCTLVCMIV
jgi:hypothetical protein